MQWLPTRDAALERLQLFLVNAGLTYERQRNYDHGIDSHDNVSCLSPWIRRRVLTEQEVYAAVVAAHAGKASDKFVSEILWRTYWKGWLERRPGVWHRYQADLQELKAQLGIDDELSKRFQQAVDANSGIECFDAWVRELKDTGYLHNHARMWFASIWIFTLKLPWQLGADFFMFHLLDGDPASNTLSWRWVGGLQTQGKHYLATANNIDKFTQSRFNPAGELREAAFCLDWAEIESAEAVPEAQLPDSTVPSVLLLSDEDLSPEYLVSSVNVTGVLSLRSPVERAAAVQNFIQATQQDALQRVLSRFVPDVFSATCTVRAADTGVGLQEIIDAIEALASPGQGPVRQVVTPYAPLGPTRVLLDQLENALSSRKIKMVRVQRRWDSDAWPYCTKGFFHFKKSSASFLVR